MIRKAQSDRDREVNCSAGHNRPGAGAATLNDRRLARQWGAWIALTVAAAAGWEEASPPRTVTAFDEAGRREGKQTQCRASRHGSLGKARPNVAWSPPSK